jgi:hypothetical protein
MVSGILAWLIIGAVFYLLATRGGGMMGCCGGHNHDSHDHSDRSGPHAQSSEQPHGQIIDLKKEDYHIR